MEQTTEPLKTGRGMSDELASEPHQILSTLPIASLRSSDEVIAVMGISGSGKSNFISHLVRADVGIGHVTSTTKMYSFMHGDQQRVCLIETPSLDNPHKSDAVVFTDIARFLAEIYQSPAQFIGIIYLHPITDTNWTDSTFDSYATLRNICDETTYDHIILATTKWDEFAPNENTGGNLLDMLVDDRIWGLMASRGSKVAHFKNSRGSALGIVEQLLSMNSSVILQIQREVVDSGLSLVDTTVGKIVVKRLQEEKRALGDRRTEVLMGPRSGDGGEKHPKEVDEDIRAVKGSLQELKFSLLDCKGRCENQTDSGGTVE